MGLRCCLRAGAALSVLLSLGVEGHRQNLNLDMQPGGMKLCTKVMARYICGSAKAITSNNKECAAKLCNEEKVDVCCKVLGLPLPQAKVQPKPELKEIKKVEPVAEVQVQKVEPIVTAKVDPVPVVEKQNAEPIVDLNVEKEKPVPDVKSQKMEPVVDVVADKKPIIEVKPIVEVDPIVKVEPIVEVIEPVVRVDKLEEKGVHDIVQVDQEEELEEQGVHDVVIQNKGPGQFDGEVTESQMGMGVDESIRESALSMLMGHNVSAKMTQPLPKAEEEPKALPTLKLKHAWYLPIRVSGMSANMAAIALCSAFCPGSCDKIRTSDDCAVAATMINPDVPQVMTGDEEENHPDLTGLLDQLPPHNIQDSIIVLNRYMNRYPGGCIVRKQKGKEGKLWWNPAPESMYEAWPDTHLRGCYVYE